MQKKFSPVFVEDSEVANILDKEEYLKIAQENPSKLKTVYINDSQVENILEKQDYLKLNGDESNSDEE